MAGVALFVGGCTAWTGPNGLGQHVLVVCKTTPAAGGRAETLEPILFSDSKWQKAKANSPLRGGADARS